MLMRPIRTTHLHALLHLKRVIEHLKAMEQMSLTDREREVVQKSLQHAYDRAEALLSPEVMRALADDGEETSEEKEDADATAGIPCS